MTRIIFKDMISLQWFVESIEWLGEEEECYGNLPSLLSPYPLTLNILTSYWYQKSYYMREIMKRAKVKKVWDYVLGTDETEVPITFISTSSKRFGGSGMIYGKWRDIGWKVESHEIVGVYFVFLMDKDHSRVRESILLECDNESNIDKSLADFLYEKGTWVIQEDRERIFKQMIDKGVFAGNNGVIESFGTGRYQYPF